MTTANWVSKTANLLVDEYDLESGETVAIGLPPHWLGVVWALSAWSAGAAVTTGEGSLAITGPDFGVRGSRETIASALLPLGGRFREPLPDGIHDYGAEVYNHPDLFVPFDPPTPVPGVRREDARRADRCGDADHGPGAHHRRPGLTRRPRHRWSE